MAPRDPTNPHPQKGAGAVSGGIYPTGQRQGTIVAYDSDSDSYTVAVEGASGDPRSSRGPVIPNIPRRKTPGIESVLNPAVPVVVDFSLRNQPYIVGSLNTNATRPATVQAGGSQIDAGGVSLVPPGEVRAGAYFRDAGTPKNMLPGDQYFTSPDGNYISVTRGRINKVFGSNRAQVIVSGMHDAVRVVCENYEHLSSIGELKIQSVSGRSSLSFVGRVDQKSERDDGTGCFAIDLGDKGQLFRLQVRDPAGRTLSEQQFSPTGAIKLLATETLNTIVAGDRNEEVGGRRLSKIKGNDVTTVDGYKTDTIDGRWKVQVGSSGTFTYGQDLAHVMQNNYNFNAGGNVTRHVTGGAVLQANPLNVACTDTIANGSHVTYLGYPQHGADPTGKAMVGQRTYIYNGAVVFGDEVLSETKVTLKPPRTSIFSAFCINTPKPDSIGLGGLTATAAALLGGAPPSAVNPAVKFIELSSLLTALLVALDTHTHPVTGVGTPSGVPAVPFSGSISGMIPTIQSTIVKMFC